MPHDAPGKPGRYKDGRPFPNSEFRIPTSPMRLTRPLIFVALALAAVLVWLAAWWLRPRVPVDVAEVRRDRIAAYVDERGITRLPQTCLVTTPSAGRVGAIPLVEGTPVKKGQVVARFVPLDVELAVKEAQAAVERLQAAVKESGDTGVEEVARRQTRKFTKSTADTVKAAAERIKSTKARLDYTNTVLARVRKLVIKDAQSQEDLDRAVMDAKQAEADHAQAGFIHAAAVSIQAAADLLPEIVEKYILRKKLGKDVAEKQLAEALVRLDQVNRQQRLGSMKSPIDGVVLHRFRSDEGYYAAGTKLLELGWPDDLEVEADLLSVDVPQVRRGFRAEIYGPAIGPIPARGTVERIEPAGFTKLSSLGVEQQRVKVIVRFDPAERTRLRSERGLSVGYRVRVRILVGRQGSCVDRSPLRATAAPLTAFGNSTWSAAAGPESRTSRWAWSTTISPKSPADSTKVISSRLTPESTLHDGQRVRPAVQPPQTGSTTVSEPLQSDGD